MTQTSGSSISGSRVKVTAVARPAEVEVRLNGRVVQSTAAIDFKGLVGSTRVTKQLTIRNVGEQPLRIFGVNSVSGYLIKGLTEGLTLRKHQAITVTISPDQSLGTKTGTLRFSTNDGDEANFAISLRAKRYVAKQIALWDTSVWFNCYGIIAKAGDTIRPLRHTDCVGPPASSCCSSATHGCRWYSAVYVT